MKKIYFLKTFVCLATGMCITAQTSYTFSGKPTYEIEAKRNNISLGTVTVELFPHIAPKHVINFDSLVAHKFYDTTAFHRVIPGFMIQGGDPNSRHGPVNTWGYGQPNQPKVPAEFSNVKHVRGILSAARSNDINSATSQFFICVATAGNLDGLYSAYGKVTAGMKVVDTIVSVPRNSSDRPLQKIEMFIKRIGTNTTAPAAPELTGPYYDQGDMGPNVLMKWKAVPGAYQYQVQWSLDSTFTYDVDSVTVPGIQYNKLNIQDMSIYYWRVRATDGGNWSKYTMSRFRTRGENTGLANVSGADSPVLYPNPSDGTFTIHRVKPGSIVEITNLTGKVIETIPVNRPYSYVDLELRSKGLYFVTVKENANIYFRTRVIVD